ncbi:glycoside hydrolase family 95 protein [Sphingomonas piscis]|uniref:Glycoside hydrolase family 95 protein n=1 Tax=Sphingomonas piscis TaxID=2714943 RepID=A0A6G7YP94_9SPHN|nr:glycoside hydrolase family 95 protein [Sphingomonas piscis]QIK78568.1 glycoside hydrolase family 95 protein [Sphingomonas piscis]
MEKDVFRLGRRSFLGASAALPLAAQASAAQTASARNDKDALALRYDRPAEAWVQALPIGNGRMGAMLFGGVAQERLQLNEDTLWAGRPYTPDNPEALAALPEVRRLIDAGRFKDAEKLASAKMMAKPLTQMPYGTLGDLFLTFDDPSAPRRYERRLDLADAVQRTTYSAASGQIVREAFASAPDQLIALHMSATGKQRIGFALSYRGPRKISLRPSDFQGTATGVDHGRAADWLGKVADPADTHGAAVTATGNQLLIVGKNGAAAGVEGGLSYALLAQIVTDGKLVASGGQLRITGARSVTLLVTAATSFQRFDDIGGDPEAIVRDRMRGATGKSFAALRRVHVADHRALFDRFSIDLGSAPTGLTTDRRIVRSESKEDPALAALYLQYARYLLIASSRPGTQPANLQGIWNEGTEPPWGSKYTININTEMNYWPADPANLAVTVEPLLRMVEELSVRGAATAKTMYGARGWVAHHNTDIWRAAAPIDGPQWGLWPCGGAWLCTTLYQHWEYSRDPRLLDRLYPLMRGAALFFLDALVEDPKGRGLVTSPSVSPENPHPFGTALCSGPAMDRQIVRDLFDFTTAVAKELGKNEPLLGQIASARARLSPDRVGKSGQFQEWLEDWDDLAPEQQHRHVSQLYAVYPSEQVNVRDTPALAEAVKVTLRTRGDLATGWATAWRACLWARLGDGDHAHDILKGLLGPKRTYPNMFDAHPPFQIDGNFGGAAAIMEMILQSWGGELRPLAALPQAWPSGSVRGIRAKGGLTVDLSWRDRALATMTVKGPPHAKVPIRYRGQVRTLDLRASGIARFPA